MNDKEFEEVILWTIPKLQTALKRPATPIPQHESIRTCVIHYEELMTSPNPALFRNATRMDKETFDNLLNLLRTEALLMNSKLLSAGEKLMIFLEALVGHSNRTIADLWQHSGSTISDTIHEVAGCFKAISHRFFDQPTANDPVPSCIHNSPRFFPHFRNVVGRLGRFCMTEEYNKML
jgi:hypothetical protein